VPFHTKIIFALCAEPWLTKTQEESSSHMDREYNGTSLTPALLHQSETCPTCFKARARSGSHSTPHGCGENPTPSPSKVPFPGFKIEGDRGSLLFVHLFFLWSLPSRPLTGRYLHSGTCKPVKGFPPALRRDVTSLLYSISLG